MAKHALIITIQRGESVSVTTQEFANKELAKNAQSQLESQLAHCAVRLYTLVVPIE